MPFVPLYHRRYQIRHYNFKKDVFIYMFYRDLKRVLWNFLASMHYHRYKKEKLSWTLNFIFTWKNFMSQSCKFFYCESRAMSFCRRISVFDILSLNLYKKKIVSFYIKIYIDIFYSRKVMPSPTCLWYFQNRACALTTAEGTRNLILIDDILFCIRKWRF